MTAGGLGLLIKKGLMFGGLIPVESPALVQRYNRALKKLTGRETKLKDFHIDISGFSPEIGDELDDPLYLNKNGMNRQFILLSTAQKDAPLINMKFSTSRGILQKFIIDNEAQLFSLTARDAVAGEMENTVFALTHPAQLFDIRQIRIVADTTGNQIAEADKLAGLIERFRTAEDAWYDDALINEMIKLAKTAGDVVRNPVRLKSTTYEQRNFWTSHFGGVYVFRDVPHPAAITVAPKDTLGEMPVAHVFDMTDRNQLARFLEMNNLVEPVVMARGINAGAVLRQKMDFILVDAAAALGLDVAAADRRTLRAVAGQLGERLPPEFQGLAALLRWVETGGPWPRITSAHPAYFYSLRSGLHADRDLVNMLLAELAPLDARQLFIFHKELFYQTYAGWPASKQAYVAEFLSKEYLVDTQGAREALFGPEPDMMAGGGTDGRDLTELVGPWGSVARKGTEGRR